MNRFSDYTNNIINKLPFWFKMKKSPNESIGAHFLNVFGLEFEDMRYILDYAFKQMYLDEMDIQYLNTSYKAYIPSFMNVDTIREVRSNNVILYEATDLSHFFDITYNPHENNSNFNKDVYLIDTEKEIIYVRKPYDISDEHKHGKITLISDNNTSVTLGLELHAVWNFFDEIGLLLECPRLPNEPNFKYKERLLNVFKYKPGSSLEGFLNALSNELDLRKTVIWKDTSSDLVLKDTMIIINKIKIDGDNNLLLENVYTNKEGHIVIKGNPNYKKDIEVSYTTGIEMHQLHNKDDDKLQSELYNVDDTATDLLKKYFDKIHSISPVIWDRFIWDKAYWNANDEDIGGMAFIPNLVDSKIDGFENYRK